MYNPAVLLEAHPRALGCPGTQLVTYETGKIRRPLRGRACQNKQVTSLAFAICQLQHLLKLCFASPPRGFLQDSNGSPNDFPIATVLESIVLWGREGMVVEGRSGGNPACYANSLLTLR